MFLVLNQHHTKNVALCLHQRPSLKQTNACKEENLKAQPSLNKSFTL